MDSRPERFGASHWLGFCGVLGMRLSDALKSGPKPFRQIASLPILGRKWRRGVWDGIRLRTNLLKKRRLASLFCQKDESSLGARHRHVKEATLLVENRPRRNPEQLEEQVVRMDLGELTLGSVQQDHSISLSPFRPMRCAYRN